jgi:RNA recognition motif-containing protein
VSIGKKKKKLNDLLAHFEERRLLNFIQNNMIKRKSKAQIERLRKRAEARGEIYTAPPSPPPDDSKIVEVLPPPELVEDNDDADNAPSASSSVGKQQIHVGDDESHKKMMQAAIQLQKELEAIEQNQDIKAKERRSAKRKAEAIAIESSGFGTAQELMDWYKNNPNKITQESQNKTSRVDLKKKTKIPYILFVGQLSYETTKDQLFEHIREELAKEKHKITNKNVFIRMLTDPKTKKSRGMAFVEIREDPEFMYACLKLHHTTLNGRRINVERSAGGSKNSDHRKSKIQNFRNEQTKYMDTVIDTVFQEYMDRGEIQKDGELDAGVIALCKRHSPSVVQTTLERYVGTNGRDMDNPSAYFTHLIGKIALDPWETNKDDDHSKKPPRKRIGQDGRSETSKRPRIDKPAKEK